MTFGTPAAPGAGDGFAYKDHLGELVVIEVLATKEGVVTSSGTADAISANVTIIAGAEPGKTFKDCLLFGKVAFGQLKGNVGQRVLVRVGQGQAQPGKSAPWIVDASTVTAEEQAYALQVLAQASMASPAAPAGGPPTAPPAAQIPTGQPPVVQPQTF